MYFNLLSISLTIYFRFFIELSARNYYCAPCLPSTRVVSNFPLCLSLIFSYFFVYKQGDSASLPFESSLPFFPFPVYLVSEFLVVFPASRFSISPPTCLSTTPFLHSHLRHPFHLHARFSRNYFYPRL